MLLFWFWQQLIFFGTVLAYKVVGIMLYMHVLSMGNWGVNEVMDLNNLTLFRMIDKERSYLSARQKVLATNVANANTPDYLPKDVEKPDFSKELGEAQKKQELELVKTNPLHMDLPSKTAQNVPNRVYTPKPTNPLSIDGNGVVLEDQLNEVSKTKGDYNRMVTIYSAYKNLIKVANTKISG